MSRLTGSDALGLFEAYKAVYVPQELTEEQVWEEVENWVNSLLEEGYDLSDYTWEEMYEEYLSEMGQRPTTGQMTAPKAAPAPTSRPQVAGGGMGGRRGGGSSPGGLVSTSRPSAKPPMSGLPANYRGAELQQAAKARASQVGTPRQGTAGGPTVGGNTPIGPSPTKTPSTAVRPAARTSGSTSVKPAAATPLASTKPKAANTPPASTPTPRVKDTSITDMIGRSQVRQGAPINTGNTSSDIRAISGRASVGASPSSAATKPTPSPVNRATGSKKPGSIVSSFDLFDVIKGHLLDEGYADTEESALAIMANMSEEWRQSIVESKNA